MTLAPEQLDALRAKHGELFAVRAGGLEVLVRMPTPREVKAAVKRFDRLPRTRRAKAQRLEQHLTRQVLRACVVHPTRAALDALLVRRPGLVVPLIKAFNDKMDALRERYT